MQIEGRVAVVTGAGSGIGRELAVAFAAAGASVVVGDLAAGGVQDTVDRITAADGSAAGVVGDAASVDGVAALLDLSLIHI